MIAALPSFTDTNTVLINKIFSIWQQCFNGVNSFYFKKTWGHLDDLFISTTPSSILRRKVLSPYLKAL
jgi:hypothetical protein